MTAPAKALAGPVLLIASVDRRSRRAVMVFVLSFASSSFVVEVMEASSVTGVPTGDDGRVATVSVNMTELGVNTGIVQTTVPVPPTGGRGAQLQPGGLGSETNVELVGTAKVRLTFAALSGPSLLAVMLKPVFEPARAGLEVSARSTETRASCANAAVGTRIVRTARISSTTTADVRGAGIRTISST